MPQSLHDRNLIPRHGQLLRGPCKNLRANMLLDLLHHGCLQQGFGCRPTRRWDHLLDSILLMSASIAIAGTCLLRKVHERIAALSELLCASRSPAHGPLRLGGRDATDRHRNQRGTILVGREVRVSTGQDAVKRCSHQAQKPKLSIADHDLFPRADVRKEAPCCVLEGAGDDVKAGPQVCAQKAESSGRSIHAYAAHGRLHTYNQYAHRCNLAEFESASLAADHVGRGTLERIESSRPFHLTMSTDTVCTHGTCCRLALLQLRCFAARTASKCHQYLDAFSPKPRCPVDLCHESAAPSALS